MDRIPWELVVVALAALAALLQRAWHMAKKRRVEEAMYEATSPSSRQGPRSTGRQQLPWTSPQAAAAREPGSPPAASEQAWERSGQEPQPPPEQAAPGGGAPGETGLEGAGLLESGRGQASGRGQRPRRSRRRPARVMQRLRHRAHLRDAFLAKEILDRPAWLRDEEH